ncbi:MAG: hypothetical protein QXO16_02925 [Archaeoglobaceae archaeon]
MHPNSSTAERQRGVLRCEADKVRKLLKEQFDAELSLEFLIRGKQRVFAFKKCDLRIKKVSEGIYFGKIEKDGLRLSIEGSFIVGRVAKKGIIEIGEEDAMRWLRGEDLEIPYKGYCILKWGEYFLGCGKGNGKKILNFVPKDRRLRNKSESEI